MSMDQFSQVKDTPSQDHLETGESSNNQATFNIDIDDSNAQHDQDTTSHDVEKGELRGGGGGLSKINFEQWARELVTVPFTITIAIVASLLASNGNEYFKLRASFPLHPFFFIVMLNFYLSVIGIIIGHRFPSVARGIYLVSFLCALLSLTMIFAAILPNGMNVVPWIFLAIVALLVISQVFYENRWYQRIETYARTFFSVNDFPKSDSGL